MLHHNFGFFNKHRNKSEKTRYTEATGHLKYLNPTAQESKFSIKDFFSKCDQCHRKLRIWAHLLKKSLMENFMFCTVPIKSQSDHHTNPNQLLFTINQLTGFHMMTTLAFIGIKNKEKL